MAYSMDLRRAVVRAAEDPSLSYREVGRRFGVTHSTVGQWVRRASTQQLEPRRSGPRGPRTLTAEDLATLRRLIDERPGTTSEEAAEYLNHKITAGYIRTLWRKMGFSFKKR